MAKKPQPEPKPTTAAPPIHAAAQVRVSSSAQPSLGDEAAQTEAAGADKAPADQVQRGAAGKIVSVIGPVRGRRRIGRRFGQEPVAIPAEDVTEGEFAALMADPELTVSIVDAP